MTRLGTLGDMGLAGRDPNTRDGLKSAGAKGDDGAARRGYYRDDFSIHDHSFGGVAGPRIGPVACPVMRIFLNLVMWAAGAIDPARWAEVELLLRLGYGVGGASVSVKAEEQAQDFLMQPVRRYRSALRDTFLIAHQELAMAIAQRHVAHACLGTPAHDLGDAKKAELVLLRARWEARGSGAGELCCAGTGALTPMTMPTCCGSWFSGRLVAGHSGVNSPASHFQPSMPEFTTCCRASDTAGK